MAFLNRISNIEDVANSLYFICIKDFAAINFGI